jgi:hypothetical protein
MTTRKEGMGLGLVICQRLVRYANGDIEINNQQAPDGKAGARVTLYFKPNRKEAVVAIIHLLDDDIAVTQACAFLLESLGYEVSCWEQGEIPR